MSRPAKRTPLSRDRVLAATVELADESGIEAVTMRKVAERLGVEAMSLYHHIANKEALLDGIVEGVLQEIEADLGGFTTEMGEAGWKATMRHRILTARQAMLRHRWAPGVIETRTTMTPTLIRYFDTLVGLFKEAGFTYDVAHHAMHALGSRALGFNQELFEPADTTADGQDVDTMMESMASEIPHIVAMLAEVVDHDPESTVGWCDDQTEFEFGLDLLLDGLERMASTP
ncbi:MAG: TetR/AcrR family transcriptional regulator C-terminal domain-containing protein [Acidimicrobiia bacterium]|nr:TetR/AcrR family transcriptional regulator C-terminal domain-containing protein [Acidimicrobiia bacterium]MDH4305961.1 TetR/AcrR family transcriptional regulator C-terminal domain-containing protein [Acidimicrobiia bacterium]MDH5292856.1 TetR/AcrR family transcriptional regulator C-terminal domain-containing protein [Acidimicrobiia bacterium]MDH5522280.1 TetR/AcrR family transcriptional regulator C-terminal domain-containing protein [Acidimicrobiia bacterium]